MKPMVKSHVLETIHIMKTVDDMKKIISDSDSAYQKTYKQV